MIDAIATGNYTYDDFREVIWLQDTDLDDWFSRYGRDHFLGWLVDNDVPRDITIESGDIVVFADSSGAWWVKAETMDKSVPMRDRIDWLSPTVRKVRLFRRLQRQLPEGVGTQVKFHKATPEDLVLSSAE